MSDPGSKGQSNSLNEAQPQILNIKLWILVLLTALVVANTFLFFAFQALREPRGLLESFLAYLDSDLFRFVTASLVVPLLLFVLEKVFGIGRAVANRIHRERERETERKEREADIRRERRWKGIEESSQLLARLNRTAGGVVCLPLEKSVGSNVAELLREVSDFGQAMNNTLNMWRFRFPNLPHEAYHHFLMFANTLLGCTETVAVFIRDSGDSAESKASVSELQNCLAAIQEGIGLIMHQPTLNLLNNGSELLDTSTSLERREELETDIARILELWEESDSVIKKHIREHTEILPTAEGPAVEEFRRVGESLYEAKRRRPETPIAGLDEFAEFSTAFGQVPTDQVVQGRRLAFTPDFVRSFARFMTLKLVSHELETMSEWPT